MSNGVRGNTPYHTMGLYRVRQSEIRKVSLRTTATCHRNEIGVTHLVALSCVVSFRSTHIDSTSHLRAIVSTLLADAVEHNS